MLSARYSSTLRRVLEYLPQSTLPDSARRSGASRKAGRPGAPSWRRQPRRDRISLRAALWNQQVFTIRILAQARRDKPPSSAPVSFRKLALATLSFWRPCCSASSTHHPSPLSLCKKKLIWRRNIQKCRRYLERRPYIRKNISKTSSSWSVTQGIAFTSRSRTKTKIRQARILLAGAGIGSIIAECALRLGFEKITIIDGDKVELSNLNRQNYTVADIGQYKAEALCRRLKSINPDADIRHVNAFINEDNVKDMVDGCDIAVNALDFKDRTPFVFDEVCSGKGIPVLHPYNFGWSGFLTVVRSKDRMLAELSSSPEGFELQVAEFAARHCASQDKRNQELEDVIRRYRTEKRPTSAPAVGHRFMADGRALRECHVQYNGREARQLLPAVLSFVHGRDGWRSAPVLLNPSCDAWGTKFTPGVARQRPCRTGRGCSPEGEAAQIKP